MTQTRAHKTFTTMCAITSYIIIPIIKQLCITSPYDLLPHGMAVAIEHASSAQAEKIESSSLRELNALVHLMHLHHKGTWTRDNWLLQLRLLRLSLPQPRSCPSSATAATASCASTTSATRYCLGPRTFTRRP